MEEVEPKPGRVDASQLQPRNDGDDPGQPSPEASDRGPVPDGPPSTHEDAENEVGEISRESSSGVVPPLDVAGGLPMPFHLMGHQSAQHEQPVSDGDESVGHDVPHVSEPSGEPTTFVEPDRSGVPLWLRN